MYANLELFIGGKWFGGDGRSGEDVINPATEKPLARSPMPMPRRARPGKADRLAQTPRPPASLSKRKTGGPHPQLGPNSPRRRCSLRLARA